MKMPAALKGFIDAIVPSLVKVIGLGGVQGWLAAIILKYGGQALYDFVVHNYARIKGMLAAKKFEHEVQQDNTREERKQDEKDFLNS